MTDDSNGSDRRSGWTDITFGRQQPQSIEAEMALLGSLLIDPRQVDNVMPMVAGADFYNPAHEAIYDRLVELHGRGRFTDLVTVIDHFRSIGVLDNVGGVEYFIELAESVPSSESATSYASIVRDKARYRGLIGTLASNLQRCYESGDDFETMAESVESAVFEACDTRNLAGGPMRLARILHDRFDSLAETKPRDALPTGFNNLDRLLDGGLRAGEYAVLGARPSQGKTALAMQIAEAMARISLLGSTPDGDGGDGGGGHVLFFSAEMSHEALADRILAAHAGISLHAIRQRRLIDSDFDRMVEAIAKLTDYRLWIDARPAPGIDYMRAVSRRLASRHGLGAVFVDYLQLLEQPEGRNPNERIGKMSAAFKAMARDLHVPVIVLAQLNREPARDHRAPQVSDLRDSGSIEQDADVILLIHRETDPNKVDYGEASVIVGKQRNGETGKVALDFRGEVIRFVDRDVDVAQSLLRD